MLINLDKSVFVFSDMHVILLIFFKQCKIILWYNLPKKEMVNYRIEQSEEWQIYGSNCDLIKISIRRNGVEYEKIGGRSYTGLPTYFPCYIRNT